MSDVRQMGEDLSYVRAAVARRERDYRAPALIPVLWAAYVLTGYSMLDLAPRYVGWFFMAGGFAVGLASAAVGRRAARLAGDVDRDRERRASLHWGGGILVALAASFAMACAVPALRGPQGSQVLVAMIGIVYFLAGVHFERHYLWLGPGLILGAALVGLFPRYGWTGLGVLIAAGLVIPTFFPRRGGAAES